MADFPPTPYLVMLARPLPMKQNARKRGRRLSADPFNFAALCGTYQIVTRSSGATYSLSPGLMSKALYQPGWFRIVPLTR